MKKMSKTRNKENLLPFHIIKACGDGSFDVKKYLVIMNCKGLHHQRLGYE